MPSGGLLPACYDCGEDASWRKGSKLQFPHNFAVSCAWKENWICPETTITGKTGCADAMCCQFAPDRLLDMSVVRIADRSSDAYCRLYLTVYHAGLFLTIFLGQIGVQGRQQGYFK